jgi:hypothetical protein
VDVASEASYDSDQLHVCAVEEMAYGGRSYPRDQPCEAELSGCAWQIRAVRPYVRLYEQDGSPYTAYPAVARVGEPILIAGERAVDHPTEVFVGSTW